MRSPSCSSPRAGSPSSPMRDREPRRWGAVLLPFLPAHRLLLLSRHGALAWGESMEEAVNGIERVEHSAIILKAAEELGGTTPLPPIELEELRALQARIGPRLL